MYILACFVIGSINNLRRNCLVTVFGSNPDSPAFGETASRSSLVQIRTVLLLLVVLPTEFGPKSDSLALWEGLPTISGSNADSPAFGGLFAGWSLVQSWTVLLLVGGLPTMFGSKLDSPAFGGCLADGL